MNINDLGSSAHAKLAAVLNTLVERHNVRLDFTATTLGELEAVYEACGSQRAKVVESASHNSYLENPSYTEATLIQEAIHIFLSEVAPKRLNRRRKSNSALGANNE